MNTDKIDVRFCPGLIPHPYLVRRLGELRLVDAAQQDALVRDGIVTLPDLQLAMAEDRPWTAAPALQRAMSLLADELRTVSLGRAWDVLDPLLGAVTAACPDVHTLEPAGGVRRAEPIVSGLSVVGCAAAPPRVIEAISALPIVTAVVYRTTRRIVLLFQGHEIDVRIATPDEHGTLLFAATGPAAHVAAVQKRRGVRLSASETEVYTHAGLGYVPPQLRHAPDAIDAAAARRVPRLVQWEDIRGDLHMHTTYSDGRDSLKRMVMAAHALGYEYFAITDHSEHSAASKTVTPSDLARQRDEIDELRDAADGTTILHGLEVDILPDGSLDCPDAVLQRLDIVLASLHDSAGHSRARLTERCLAAIRHPLVSVITHPGNQLIGHRPAYDMDYDAIYAAAADTGTALEIDGAPSHLDLDGDRARAAAAAGVTLVIDSDCHRARSLDRQMRLGVGTARRGWVEPRHVLNTRPIGDVLAFLAQKRR
jgi:DNA polymerase (family X)